MKYFSKIIHLFILIFFVIFQIVFGEQLEIYHISFDFILVTLIAITIKDGLLTGMLLSFIAGMIFDLLSSTIVGITPFLFSLSAFIIVRFINSGLRLKLISYVFIVVIITEINVVLLNIIYYLFNFRLDLVSVMLELLTKPLLNTVLIFIIFPLFRLKFSGEDIIEYNFK